jgi:hypothetical protein
MLNVTMLKSPVSTKASRSSTGSRKGGGVKEEEIAAAELALKAHVLASDPEMLAEMTNGDRVMQETADMVNLTEAPEDAVCSLVIGLLQYCELENIDWNQEVMSRAREHLHRERAYEVQKR